MSDKDLTPEMSTLLSQVLYKLDTKIFFLNRELSFALAAKEIKIIEKKQRAIREAERIKELLESEPEKFLEEFGKEII